MKFFSIRDELDVQRKSIITSCCIRQLMSKFSSISFILRIIKVIELSICYKIAALKSKTRKKYLHGQNSIESISFGNANNSIHSPHKICLVSFTFCLSFCRESLHQRIFKAVKRFFVFTNSICGIEICWVKWWSASEGSSTSTHMNAKRWRSENEENEKKCSSETSARLTNRNAPLKHRRLHDYDAEAVKRTSRAFYDDFVRKLGLKTWIWMNELSIQTPIVVARMFLSSALVRNK
jgi:hypothetical protein